MEANKASIGSAIGLSFSTGPILDGYTDTFCAACGKDMVDPETGTLLVGVSLKLRIGDYGTFSKGFIEEQFGQYRDNTTYNICWECWLKSLGVKPKEK